MQDLGSRYQYFLKLLITIFLGQNLLYIPAVSTLTVMHYPASFLKKYCRWYCRTTTHPRHTHTHIFLEVMASLSSWIVKSDNFAIKFLERSCWFFYSNTDANHDQLAWAGFLWHRMDSCGSSSIIASAQRYYLLYVLFLVFLDEQHQVTPIMWWYNLKHGTDVNLSVRNFRTLINNNGGSFVSLILKQSYIIFLFLECKK